jgi:ketosteroid isomerase-like protein
VTTVSDGERNIELVRGIHESLIAAGFEKFRLAAVNAKNWDDSIVRLPEAVRPLMQVIDPDIEIDARHFPLPFGSEGHWVGREQWLQFWKTWLEPWDEFSYEVSNFDSAGDDVLMDLAITARGHDSHVPVEWVLSQIWTVRDGTIVRMRPYENREEALAVLQKARGAGSDPTDGE